MQQTVLVVDDEEVVLKLVCTVLTGADYNVRRAGSGREAIALCRHNTGTVHLALLDVMMPGMNGPDLGDCLRNNLPSLRILFMSGYSYGELASRGVRASADGFLAKPFTITALLNKVQEVLAETRRHYGSE